MTRVPCSRLNSPPPPPPIPTSQPMLTDQHTCLLRSSVTHLKVNSAITELKKKNLYIWFQRRLVEIAKQQNFENGCWIFDICVTFLFSPWELIKYNQGLWKWYGWVKLNDYCHHASLTFIIFIMSKNIAMLRCHIQTLRRKASQLNTDHYITLLVLPSLSLQQQLIYNLRLTFGISRHGHNGIIAFIIMNDGRWVACCLCI